MFRIRIRIKKGHVDPHENMRIWAVPGGLEKYKTSKGFLLYLISIFFTNFYNKSQDKKKKKNSQKPQKNHT